MALAVAVMGAVVGMIGAIKSGQAANAQAKSQANAADYNSKQDIFSGIAASQGAASDEEKQHREASMALGRQIAGASQSGFSLTSGSNADLIEQSATNAAMDSLSIEYGGALRAKGFSDRSTLDALSARSYARAGSDALTAGYINAASRGLSAYRAGAYGGSMAGLVPGG